jgi:hypothetical protein
VQNVNSRLTASHGKSSIPTWLRRTLRRTATRIRHASMRDWVGVAVPVVGALFLAGAIAYAITGDGSKVLADAPVATTPAPKLVSAATSNYTSPGSDAMSLAQQHINLLVTEQGEVKQGLNEVRTATSANMSEITSVKTDVGAVREIINKEDPQMVKALREDLERLKKIMAIPLVPLKPFKSLNVANKTP